MTFCGPREENKDQWEDRFQLTTNKEFYND